MRNMTLVEMLQALAKVQGKLSSSANLLTLSETGIDGTGMVSEEDVIERKGEALDDVTAAMAALSKLRDALVNEVGIPVDEDLAETLAVMRKMGLRDGYESIDVGSAS